MVEDGGSPSGHRRDDLGSSRWPTPASSSPLSTPSSQPIRKTSPSIGEGKTNLLGFFVGQVMKSTNGKANPRLVNDLLRSKLDVTAGAVRKRGRGVGRTSAGRAGNVTSSCERSDGSLNRSVCNRFEDRFRRHAVARSWGPERGLVAAAVLPASVPDHPAVPTRPGEPLVGHCCCQRCQRRRRVAVADSAEKPSQSAHMAGFALEGVFQASLRKQRLSGFSPPCPAMVPA